MQKEEVLKQNRDNLKKQYAYCEQLLWKLYPRVDKTKIKEHMQVMKQEIDTLTYCINDDLPF
jgi:hypothetical protein